MEEVDWKPNLFIAGFPKCGTTALCEYLSQHPDVYVIEKKEPYTISTEGVNKAYWMFVREKWGDSISGRVLDMGSYRKFFKENYRKIRVDASQTYALSTKSARILKSFSPSSKAILCIRPQLDRLISSYFYTMHIHQKRNIIEYIEEFLEPSLETFLFYKVTKSFYEEFGDELRVIDSICLKNNPHRVLRKVFSFLGIEDVELKEVVSNPNPYSFMRERTAHKVSFILGLIRDISYVPFNFLVRTGILSRKMAWTLRVNYSPVFLFKKVAKIIPFKKSKKNKVYENLKKQVIEEKPNLVKVIVEDYEKTLTYSKDKKILLD